MAAMISWEQPMDGATMSMCLGQNLALATRNTKLWWINCCGRLPPSTSPTLCSLVQGLMPRRVILWEDAKSRLMATT